MCFPARTVNIEEIKKMEQSGASSNRAALNLGLGRRRGIRFCNRAPNNPRENYSILDVGK
jgi:hypothetical protein